jgi:hypothetical protein
MIQPRTYPRTRWSARSPRATTAQDPHKVKEFFVHHSASPGKGIDSLDEQIRTMQGMQDFHMDERGWSDIAYHYVVFQPYGNLNHARIFVARSILAVPAAQLGHNTNTEAVCVVSRTGEPIKRATKDALIWLYGRSHATRARGHFEVVDTECPGPELKKFLPELRRSKR